MPINIPVAGRGEAGAKAGSGTRGARAATFVPPHLLEQQRARAHFRSLIYGTRVLTMCLRTARPLSVWVSRHNYKVYSPAVACTADRSHAGGSAQRLGVMQIACAGIPHWRRPAVTCSVFSACLARKVGGGAAGRACCRRARAPAALACRNGP